MPRVVALIAAVLALLVAACGGGGQAATRRATRCDNVPTENGIRESVEQARSPTRPISRSPKARRSQQLADEMTAGPSLALASSIFVTPGDPAGWRSA